MSVERSLPRLKHAKGVHDCGLFLHNFQLQHSALLTGDISAVSNKKNRRSTLGWRKKSGHYEQWSSEWPLLVHTQW